MLHSAKRLVGYKIRGKDGDIGKLEEFFFDDLKWIMRYLVVDISDWLGGKHEIISPASFLGHPDWERKIFSVDLTKDKLKGSPDIDMYKSLTRQEELKLIRYHNWPIYWETHSQDFIPTIKMPTEHETSVSDKELEICHLRRTNEVIAYHVHARDGEIGYLEDFIVDGEIWAIRYMVVDIQNWLTGKKVLLAPQWVERVCWDGSKLYMDLSKEEIKNSPKYEYALPVSRKYEEVLYDYYGRPRYWHE